jgi:hypothetical protein
VIKHNFDQTPVLLENFDQVIRSSAIRSSDPLSKRLQSTVKLGYNKLGFYKLGYNKLSYNKLGFNKLVYNKLVYNKLGFNKLPVIANKT